MPRKKKEPHYLTVFDTDGDHICDVPFDDNQWERLLNAAVQMFVVTAIEEAIKREERIVQHSEDVV